ncbi:hypothetical protein niasHS_007762 [Heterodera schachtii]|uniref:Uncharacterized protein n=1 Tax=Heterodera schachtii TaxID=97005 RepID=A0ABD2JPN7_HETSC
MQRSFGTQLINGSMALSGTAFLCSILEIEILGDCSVIPSSHRTVTHPFSTALTYVHILLLFTVTLNPLPMTRMEMLTCLGPLSDFATLQ